MTYTQLDMQHINAMLLRVRTNREWDELYLQFYRLQCIPDPFGGEPEDSDLVTPEHYNTPDPEEP